MPTFAANLTLMFKEWDFLDRFQASSEAGFTAVEILFPYDQTPEAIAAALERTGQDLALINLPPGDLAKGERGLAALPDRHAEMMAGVETALPYLKATGCPRVHLMAGIADAHDPRALAAFRKAVADVADRLMGEDVQVLLEPINGRDIPSYFLTDFALAEAVITDLARPNLKLQFDVYHRQILHGDVTHALRRLMPMIGHVQIASVPNRCEPDSGELNYPFLFQELDLMGYEGLVAAEYNPRGKTMDGLDWMTDAGGRSGV
jgi:hydroxypyruvate isomerase